MEISKEFRVEMMEKTEKMILEMENTVDDESLNILKATLEFLMQGEEFVEQNDLFAYVREKVPTYCKDEE